MPLPSRRELLALAALALVGLVLAVRYMRAAAAPPPAAAPAAVVEPPRGSARDRATVVVHVAGAVREPGVLRLPQGARVRDAIRRAGGATSRADVHAVNLAARVADAQRVVVPERPRRGPAAAASSSGAAATPGAAGAAGPVSLGTATVEQLDALDGIGPALAAKIVAHREERGGFGSVDELAEVPGIGPKRLEALREAVQP